MRTGKPNEPPNKAKLRMEEFKAARGILFKKNIPAPKVVNPKEEDLHKEKAAAPRKKLTTKKSAPKKKILSTSKSNTKKKTVRPKKNK